MMYKKHYQNVLPQVKFQGCASKLLKVTEGFNLFPNFYNGLKQHSVFFFFSITKSSGLPRNIHTHAQKQSELYNSVEQQSENLAYQKPKWCGFQFDWWLQWFKSKEHKTQTWRWQDLISFSALSLLHSEQSDFNYNSFSREFQVFWNACYSCTSLETF